MRTIAVIPCYNEGPRVAEVVRAVAARVDVVVAVDDGSRDDTAAALAASPCVLLKHRVNLGKAAALKTGLLASLRLSPDALVLLDADGQHRPEDIPVVLAPLRGNQADMVVAVRALDRSMPAVRRFGNWMLARVARALFAATVPDIQSGFRAFRATAVSQLLWTSSGYAADAELTCRAAWMGLRVLTVSIPTVYGDAYKGMGIADGVQLLGLLLSWRAQFPRLLPRVFPG